MRAGLLLALALVMKNAAAIDVQGHRGARGHLPENTLASFELALSMGVNTLELDTGVTRDGVVVIHHDRRLNPDLARGPDGNWVQAPAPTIHSLTFAELQRYDVGRLRPGSQYEKNFPSQKPLDGARIPRLADLLEAMRGSNVRFNIETKLSAEAPDETLGPDAFARAVIREVRKAGLMARTTIQSFDWRTLKVVEREAHDIATAYLTSAKDSEPSRVRKARARIWSPNFQALNAEMVASAHALGLSIVPWTVNQPADIARVLELKVDGIISDYPDRVIEELKRRGLR
jgi:glycerophosphoryl diester phosphodiesterase